MTWVQAAWIAAGIVLLVRGVVWLLARRYDRRNRQVALEVLRHQHALMRAKGIEPRYDDEGKPL